MAAERGPQAYELRGRVIEEDNRQHTLLCLNEVCGHWFRHKGGSWVEASCPRCHGDELQVLSGEQP